jgi:hypothetical protein
MEEATNHVPSMIDLVEEFVDDEVNIVTIPFPQLTLVSHKKMYSPYPDHTI